MQSIFGGRCDPGFAGRCKGATASLVDAKSREALAGLGTLSEARQLLFASLLLADEMVDGGKSSTTTPPQIDPALADRAERIADRLESLASTLETEAARA